MLCPINTYIMYVEKLLREYVPLIDTYIMPEKNTRSSDASLLVTSPEEIQENLQRWRDYNERIHIVV